MQFDSGNKVLANAIHLFRAASLLLLAATAAAQVNVTGYHNNLGRTGENLAETILTLSNVNAAGFGKLFSRQVDGQIYAQPLYLSLVNIPGKGIHNVVYVATEHDSVYAFDADSATGPNALPLWQTSFLNTAAGVTTVSPSDIFGCSMITPEQGITGTPALDPATKTLYVVAVTKENGGLYQRLHALDATTGVERPASPVEIQASIPGSGDIATPDVVKFYPERYTNRAGLLLVNGMVYIGWSSHCDQGTYHGWIMGYDAATLRQLSLFNATPNAYRGSIWMGGAAPASDADGNVYLVTGNGKFDPPGSGSDFGDSFLRLSPQRGLALADYFTPFNQEILDDQDIDLGSSGVLVLPDEAGSAEHPHLLVGAGKEGRIYVLDRDQLGQYHANDDSQVVQSLAGAIHALYGTAAYFNGTLYFAGWNDALKAFPISGAHMAVTPSSQTSQTFGYPGGSPSVSANGTANGIVWILESGGGGTLHAYSAADLTKEFYNSGMQAARDTPGAYVKFSVPTVANGKVFVGTGNGLAVFGLLDQPGAPAPAVVVNAASYQAGPVAPGSLVSIFGANLAGATVTINGIPAPVLYSSAGQINIQIPVDAQEGTATAVLQVPEVAPGAIAFSITAAAPGIFAANPNQAVIRNADESINSPEHPAQAGSLVTVYLTGQGAVAPAVETGSPAPADSPACAAYPVVAMVGSQAAEIVQACLTSGAIGVFQVNLRVPALAAGPYPLVISINGASSNTVSLNVTGS